MRLTCSFTLAAMMILAATACSDPVAPTPDLVAGSYMATSFQAEGNDVLAAGGSLTLVLTASGGVTGNLFVPASVGGPLNADMAGTYGITGSNITFDQDADTFVRDATWTWSSGVLTGSFGPTASGVTVQMER